MSKGNLVDFGALEKLNALDSTGETLLEVVGIFRTKAPQLTRSMKEAEKKGDLERLAKEAHQVRSTFAYVGATGAASSCEKIETISREKSASGKGAARLRELVEKVEKDLPLIEKELKAYSSELKTGRKI